MSSQAARRGAELLRPYRVLDLTDELGELAGRILESQRIRDVEVGPDGFVYLLLEHATGGRIVRLVPADGP